MTSYLEVWRLRGDWKTLDALHAAACWEYAGQRGVQPMDTALKRADAIMLAALDCPFDLECDHLGESCYHHAHMWTIGNAGTPWGVQGR